MTWVRKMEFCKSLHCSQIIGSVIKPNYRVNIRGTIIIPISDSETISIQLCPRLIRRKRVSFY